MVLLCCAPRASLTPTPRALEAPISTSAAALDRSAVRLGARIRELRRARRLTLVELASLAALSHSFLSQLERGLARPSMVSLERIARALGSSQVELLAGTLDGPPGAVGAPGATDATDADHEGPPPVVVRSNESPWGPFGDGRARLLVTGDRRLSPLEFVGANAAFGDFFVHAEDEFLSVLGGSLVVDLGADDVHQLGSGDSLYCEGGTPHRWRSASSAPYRLFLVKENPRRP